MKRLQAYILVFINCLNFVEYLCVWTVPRNSLTFNTVQVASP